MDDPTGTESQARGQASRSFFFSLFRPRAGSRDDAAEFGPASGHSSDGIALHCAKAH